MPPMFTQTVADRFPVIEPYIRGKTVMDLGCVDSRKARHNAEERFEYKANLLHKRIAEANPDTLGQLWKIGVNHLKWMGGSLSEA